MKELITKIITSCIHAPSGENSQPWKFLVADDHVKIFNIPENDKSVYNFDQKASYFAHGCLAENFIIKSPSYGLEASLEAFPNSNITDHVSTIKFKTNPTLSPNPLNKFIETRCTNRKHFEKKPISPSILSDLATLTNLESGKKIIITEEKKQIQNLAKTVAINERILFEHQNMHDFLFDHINWSKEEDLKKSVGFFIDTLELPLPGKFIFKLSKNWGTLNFLNKLGLSHIIQKANTETYKSCGAYVAIISKEIENVDFFNSGRFTQKFWLTATKNGVSLQPLNGVLLLIKARLYNPSIPFSKKHIQLLDQAKNILEYTFRTAVQNISFIFRMGYSSPPTARASRLKPKISYV